MKEYKLYLDESINTEKQIILVAGFAIREKDIDFLKEQIHKAKTILWTENYINSHDTILHCTELATIKNNRKNKLLYSYIKRNEYKFFQSIEPNLIKDKIDGVTEQIRKTISTLDITILGCIIDINKYKEYYSKEQKDDIYNIAIQNIIENYAHFLKNQNAIGDIVYESRDEHKTINSADIKMYHNYCKTLINNKGILNINNLEIRKRIRSFVTISKHTENAGIELADYIAFYLIKSLFIDTDQKSDIIKTMEKKLYNGGFKVIEKDVRNYFGLRQIPFDYEELKRKNAEIHTLKNRLRNIKREKNKLIKKVDVLIKEKRELEYTIKELEKKQKNLNNT